MSLHRDHGEIVFECDGCGETLETLTTDFWAAAAKLKDEGWRTRKRGQEWEHFCSEDCAE